MITLLCAYCTTSEAFKILEAQTLINRTLPTHCFANKLAERGVSDGWINRLQGANERLSIRFYFEDNKVVGWTYAGDTNINLNRKFHSQFSACKTASNVVHELTHTLGYQHKSDVAYAANYAFEACCL